MRTKYLISLLLLTTAANANTTDSLRTLLDSAINCMQNLSVYTKKVNWKTTRDTSYQMIAHAKNYEDVYPAIQYAFNKLNDYHGYLVLGGQKYRNPFAIFDTGRITPATARVAAAGPKIYTGKAGQDYAYVSIPFFSNQDKAAGAAFAQQIQDSLCKTIHAGTKRIIIDLRLNAGGTLLPMVAGLANILGDGVYLKNVNAQGFEVSENKIENGSVRMYDSSILKIKQTCGDLTKIPVVVIIGAVTASSGEMLAIAFRSRKNTIIAGETSGGYVTSNDGRYLPGTGNGIVLSMEYVRDVHGKEYRKNVHPDVVVKDGEDFFDLTPLLFEEGQGPKARGGEYLHK